MTVTSMCSNSPIHERESPPTGCDFGSKSDCGEELLFVLSIGKTIIHEPSATHAY
jgi:hypothetical protein